MVDINTLIAPNRIVIFKSADKNEALKELCSRAAADVPCHPDYLEEAVFKREVLMSTGIGLGIAVPHVRLPEANKQSLAVGISREGIDYGSLDDDPVHIIILIVAPENAHDAYIKLLAKVVLMLKNEDFRKELIAAPDSSTIFNLLIKHK